MIEPALYAALGAFAAILVGLLTLPALWRRAVWLTTRRLTDRLPVSLDEILAAQDRLRAEHAMALRAVERTAERAGAEAARERIAAARARSTELGFIAETAALRAKVAALEADGAELRETLDRTGAEAALVAKALETARLEASAAAGEAKAARDATAATETQADALRLKLDAASAEFAALQAEHASAREELAKAHAALSAQERAEATLAAQLKRETSRVADAEAAQRAAERQLAETSAAFVADRAAVARRPDAAIADPSLADLRVRLDDVADAILRVAETPPKRAPLPLDARRDLRIKA